MLSVYVSASGGDASGDSRRLIGNKVTWCRGSTRLGSGGTTFVSMMEPTHLRDRDDPPGLWCLDGA